MMNYYLTVLKKYAQFDGRSRRSEFWYFVLVNWIISIALNFVDKSMELPGLVGGIYSLAVFIPNIAVSIRRMHDIGKSGWFILIPFYNIYLFTIDSEQGTNEYGPNPKNPEMDTLDHLVD